MTLNTNFTDPEVIGNYIEVVFWTIVGIVLAIAGQRANSAYRGLSIAASGTFGYGVEFEDVVHLAKLGGFVVKGLSREPMIGNPPPRLWETPAGMLNAIGLQNIGAPAFLQEKLPHLRQLKDVVVMTNVFGYTREDYVHTVELLNEGDGIADRYSNVEHTLPESRRQVSPARP